MIILNNYIALGEDLSINFVKLSYYPGPGVIFLLFNVESIDILDSEPILYLGEFCLKNESFKAYYPGPGRFYFGSNLEYFTPILF